MDVIEVGSNVDPSKPKSSLVQYSRMLTDDEFLELKDLVRTADVQNLEWDYSCKENCPSEGYGETFTFYYGHYIKIIIWGAEAPEELKAVREKVGSLKERATEEGTKKVITNRKPTGGTMPCDWVFKTRNDYSDKVSVLLNREGTQITGHPLLGPMTKLDKGYYTAPHGCVNYGEGQVAFTSVEWNGTEPAFIDILMNQIIDRYPFTELYYCEKGASVEELNEMIREGWLRFACLEKD
jgi:hypothetical protein